MGHEGQNYLTNMRYELEIVPIQTCMKQICRLHVQVTEDRLPERPKRKVLASVATRRRRRLHRETDHDAVSTYGGLSAKDKRYTSGGADAGQAPLEVYPSTTLGRTNPHS